MSRISFGYIGLVISLISVMWNVKNARTMARGEFCVLRGSAQTWELELSTVYQSILWLRELYSSIRKMPPENENMDDFQIQNGTGHHSAD